jgi:hypothetical protein
LDNRREDKDIASGMGRVHSMDIRYDVRIGDRQLIFGFGLVFVSAFLRVETLLRSIKAEWPEQSGRNKGIRER